MDQVTITTEDGVDLVGSVFPGGDECILIGPAMATPQSFYWKIGAFLQAQGFTVLTFDFRGIGLSRQGSLRGFKANCTDWAMLDQKAAMKWLREGRDCRTLHIIGHSFGGQVVGLLGDEIEVDKMITVCSQSGYWRLQGGHQWWQTLFHMSFTFPILSHLFGYMPWSRFAKACDLPKGAALQWARWCRHRHYLFGDHSLPLHRYADFQSPILAFSIDDDDWGTARSVDELMAHYPNVERRHIVPSDWDLKHLGHTGFFRPKSERLWHSVVDWLRAP